MPYMDDPVTAEELGNMDEEYGKTQALDENAPDGTYQVIVHRMELDRTQQGTPLLKWQLKITNGDHAGQILFKSNMLTPEHLKWVKTDLKRCGVELEKLSDLPDRLMNLLDLRLEVTQKTKTNESTGKAYPNVYINRKLNGEKRTGTEDEPPPIDDDDVLF